jgi:hypothetical protein
VALFWRRKFWLLLEVVKIYKTVQTAVEHQEKWIVYEVVFQSFMWDLFLFLGLLVISDFPTFTDQAV